MANYNNKQMGAGRVCLFTRMEDNCDHPECVMGKTVAQSQPVKAYNSGGLMASYQAKTEHFRFRETLNQRQQPNKPKW